VAEVDRLTAQTMANDPEVKALDSHQEAGAKGGRGKKANGDTKSFPQPGTVPHRIRRLKRDAPDLNARVAAGELSLADAERQAGIDPRGRRLWLPAEPQKAAATIRERFGKQFADGLARALSGFSV
jgi:hypothetical protein